MERVSDSKRAYLSGQVPCSDRHAWASESEWKENEHVIVSLTAATACRGTCSRVRPVASREYTPKLDVYKDGIERFTCFHRVL